MSGEERTACISILIQLLEETLASLQKKLCGKPDIFKCTSFDTNISEFPRTHSLQAPRHYLLVNWELHHRF